MESKFQKKKIKKRSVPVAHMLSVSGKTSKGAS